MPDEAEVDATLELIAAARWGSETQVGNALEKIGSASKKIAAEKIGSAAEKIAAEKIAAEKIAAEKIAIASKNYKEKAGYGYTPLHTAVFKNTRVAWVLIQDKEVDLNAETDLGQTTLHSGWPQCVDAMLLSRRFVKWDEPDKIGQTPLLYHARLVNDECLKAVLKLGDDVDIEKETEDGFTVLHQVVERASPFPNWYNKKYDSPKFRCKVVGLLLNERKRRALQKSQQDGDHRSAHTAISSNAGNIDAEITAKAGSTHTAISSTAGNITPKSEPTPAAHTQLSAPPPPDTAEPAAARKGCSQLFDCLIPRAKKDTNTNENQDQPGARQPDGGERSKIPKTDPVIEKTDTREAELQSVVANFVNKQDKIGRTALHYIAEDGCVKILDKLLNWFTVEDARSKVDVNILDDYGFAPLHLAVRKGHTQMVERLLNEPKTDACVTVAPGSPKTGLMGWEEEHLEMCRPNLFSKAPEEKILIKGLTALHFAAMGGHTEIADLLLNWKRVTKQGDRSETTTVVVTAKDEEKLQSPFTYSIDNNRLEVATLLLRRIEAEGDPRDAFERMLTLAMGKQRPENLVLEVLKKSKQVAGIKNTFELLLFVAANVNLPDVIRSIFNWEPEVDLNFKATWEDDRNSSILRATPLHFAILRGHVDKLRATPLHFAVLRGHVDIVKQLLSHKSLDVNAEDTDGRTPLQIAVEGDRSRHAKDGHKIQRKQIKELLMERAEVKDLVERLYRDREVFINAVNALLVGAALIATVTFAGWLTPPLGLTAYVPPEPSPASPATSPHYLSLPQPTSVKVFWVSNSLSFFFAIATVLFCAYAAMPSLEYIGEAVKSLKTTLIWASTLFLFSVFFVLGAFASAGFAVLPSPHRAYKLSMKSTVAIGGVICGCCLILLIWQLLRQLCEYIHGKKTRPTEANKESHDDCEFPTFCKSMIL
jgi:ankyrin repeat protein